MAVDEFERAALSVRNTLSCPCCCTPSSSPSSRVSTLSLCCCTPSSSPSSGASMLSPSPVASTVAMSAVSSLCPWSFCVAWGPASTTLESCAEGLSSTLMSSVGTTSAACVGIDKARSALVTTSLVCFAVPAPIVSSTRSSVRFNWIAAVTSCWYENASPHRLFCTLVLPTPPSPTNMIRARIQGAKFSGSIKCFNWCRKLWCWAVS